MRSQIMPLHRQHLVEQCPCTESTDSLKEASDITIDGRAAHGDDLTCTLASINTMIRINLVQAAALLHAFVQIEVAHLLGANSGATCTT